MKTTLLAIALMLAAAGAASAYHSSHLWMKESVVYGEDGFGNRVQICTWKCTADYQNPHYAQTQGSGFCPMPSP